MADLIYKASQNRLLTWNSKNLQNLGFLWKKNRVFLTENGNFLQSAYAWTILWESVSNGVYDSKFSKRSKFGTFWRAKCLFFRIKNLDLFKAHIHALSLLKCVSNGVCVWDFGDRSTFGFFGEPIVFFQTNWIFSKLVINKQRLFFLDCFSSCFFAWHSSRSSKIGNFREN